MKPHEQIAQLEKENQQLRDQVAGLTKRLDEMKQVQKEEKPSKSRLQAQAGMELLQKGPVTKVQLIELNPKYPSDVMYYVRTLLHQDVKAVKTKAGTVYMLPEHYAVYVEGLKREEEAAAALVAAKEAVPASQAETVA